ncbi:MAG: putative ABC transporter permease subunit [Caldicoprobacterales bacterium]|jgi:ABC-2 type transport system permease protein
MKTFVSLLKASLNVHFGISSLKYRFTKEKKRLWEPIVVLLAIVVGGGSILAMYSFLLLAVFMAGQSLGHPEIVITLAFVASQLIILIFGIFYIISAFYFSNDMSILIPLPIKPGEVLGVKFITILLSEYLIALPMLLPAFIIYGAGSWQGILYWLKGAFLILLAPILPLVIAALIVVLLMRFINIRKGKDVMVIIGSLLALMVGLGINFFSLNLPQGTEEEFIMQMIESNTGLIEAIGNKFPPSIWATLALTYRGWQGWAYFLLFVGLSFLLLFLLYWIGNRFFYKGYLTGQEIRRKDTAISTREMQRHITRTSSPILALLKREWKLFMRTPIYVMNGLAGMIMVPIFMFMPLVTNSEELTEVLEYARNPEYSLIVILISLGIMLFTSGINVVSCTSISREGATFWISKVIPTPPKDQVLAKLIHSSILSLLGLIIVAIPLYIVVAIPLLHLTILIILGFLATGLINVLGLMVDLLRPKLSWNDPQEAIKQNLNAFFSLLIVLLVIAIMAVLSIILIAAKVGEFWIYGILALIIIVLLVPSMYGLFALANLRYRSIEI